MATLAVQPIDQDGLEPTFAAATVSGDKVPAGEGVFIAVRNTNGATRTVTINDPTSRTPDAAAAFNPDVAVVIDATTGETWIPVPERFADPADGGLAALTYSAVTGLTIGAFRI